MKHFSRIVVAVLVFSLAVLSFGWRTEKSVFAASGDVPPTVVKGRADCHNIPRRGGSHN